MPHTCVIRGCKNRAIPRHEEQATPHAVAFHRFPLKNERVLECWEHFVQEANMLDVTWKATKFTRICSDHFHTSDYIIPPSINWPCRLRQCVAPSKETSITSYPTMADELKRQLDFSKKRPVPPTDQKNLSSPEKIARTSSTDTFPSMVAIKSMPACRFWLGGGLDPGETK